MSEKLVTVVVPCYNHQDYVEDCIQSIIEQSYQNIELIIIDDGSKDDSVKKIQSFEQVCNERFVRFHFIHRPNKGACATLNEGISLATGDYIALFASDDAMLPGRIASQVAIMHRDLNIKAVFGAVKNIDDNGTLIGKTNVAETVYDYEDILLNRAKLLAPTMLIDSVALKEVSPIPEDVVIEDRYIQLSITEKYGKCIFSSKEFYAYYRRHGSNTSSNIDKLFEKNVELINRFECDKKLKRQAIANNLLGYAISMALNNKTKAFKALFRALKYDVGVVVNKKLYHGFFNILVK
ncbi:glycosyltransferase [Pseudoalteromonas luteoviolacea]|uniref:glycosyltransferase family 2 protein n=1 Tax=Pseudoalteromonas luteoviolacea TaxID=43657 RepID=UPI001F3AF0D8|nr:glycosyltransferase [Pseudoalteromonas luteoviolacea]MCF6439045.1 glycosyltransferase [Pseudoalteromonas luteoviolacea]